MTRFGSRAAIPQIGDDSPPDVDRKGQPFLPTALAPHNDLSATPVDVTQLQGRELASAQAKSSEHGQDGEIAATHRGTAVTAG